MISNFLKKFDLLKGFNLANQIRSSFSLSNQQIASLLQTYYKKNDLLEGYASYQQTSKYRQRYVSKKLVHQNFYSKIINHNQGQMSKDSQLFISSLGIGTQNGEPKPEDDYKMAQVLVEALTNGINYIDTDINFRYGKSQKVINACLNYLIKQKGFKRQQFFISTKFGYIPTDVDSNLESEKLIEILKGQRYINDQNVVEQIYGWGQGFIEFCIQKSRISLGLQTLDNVFLNNFSQSQMSLIPEQEFKRRLTITLKKLQQIRSSNRIRNYGVCSFVGFRSPPDQQGVHLNLQQVCRLVKDCVGQKNGFKYIMLPLSLGMPEGLLKWQKYQDQNETEMLRVFDVAEKQGLKIILCSPLFQGRVAGLPFSTPKLNYLSSNAAKHVQFIRSISSSALVSTIFGTNNLIHLKQNMEVLKYDQVAKEDFNKILPIPQ